MKSFIKFYSDFWINPDNTALMQLGTDAKLMAIYLQGNAHYNMLGVPLLYIASDLKQLVKKVRNTLNKLCELSYCKYDEQTQYI